MALNLYRRHFPGKCLGAHALDSRTYEAEERRRRAKKCACPIYADGTLGGKFRRKNTQQIEWDEVRRVAADWEAVGAWDAPVVSAPPPELPVTAPEQHTRYRSRISVTPVTIQFNFLQKKLCGCQL